MVRVAGFEPARDCSQGILSPWCLPFHHTRICSTRLQTLGDSNHPITKFLKNFVSTIYFCCLQRSLLFFITYILYNKFFKKSNKWQRTWVPPPVPRFQRPVSQLLDESALLLRKIIIKIIIFLIVLFCKIFEIIHY